MMNLSPAYEQWYAKTIEEGAQRERNKTARRMLQKKMLLAEIIELTGLTLEEVQALQAEERS
jgi:predicted transposase YdaD